MKLMTELRRRRESEYDMWNVLYVLERPFFFGISTCILGAGRCPVCAHDSRKMEHSRVVRAPLAELYFFLVKSSP